MQMSMGSSHAIHVSAEQALSVKGSSVELTAVLTTLLSNAIEASDAGQDIEVNVAKLEHRIVIRVVDRGQGLSPDIEQRLFQPHVTTKAEGAGMGLYIAKRIVTLHYEGDLSVVNNCTKGCTAILSLSNGNLTIHNERKR